jgi:hypothetical protein
VRPSRSENFSFGPRRNISWPYLVRTVTDSWSRVLLEKITLTQQLKIFPVFHGIRRFITVYTRARHWPFFWAGWVQPISSASHLFNIHFTIFFPFKPGSLNSCNYWTSWSSGEHSCFVFGRSWVQISVRKPAVVTEVFRGFPQSLQVNVEIVPWNRSRLLPSTCFPF